MNINIKRFKKYLGCPYFVKFLRTEEDKMIQDQKLSKNFWLRELTKSSTATRLGINNWPDDQQIVDNLTKVVYNIVQPVRDHFGVAFSPESGYRCLALNRALKSDDTSKHVTGQAVDIEVPGISNYDLAAWIKDSCDFDQLLLEFYYPGKPTSGWVHISFVDALVNRKQILTINDTGTYKGLLT